MAQPQPIETRYKGYRFRSRLEARWAVFFDHCKEQWIYEHEGFRLRSGHYLPDFFFPKHNAFVEIKALDSLPTRNFEFGLRTQRAKFPIDDVFPRELLLVRELHILLDLPSWHCVVVYGDPRDVIDGEGGAVSAVSRGLLQGIGFIDRFPASLFGAADAARAARFEHGEQLA